MLPVYQNAFDFCILILNPALNAFGFAKWKIMEKLFLFNPFTFLFIVLSQYGTLKHNK